MSSHSSPFDGAAAVAFDREATEVMRLFPTPFIVAPVADSASLNMALAEIIVTRARNDPGVQLSNDGGWQSPGDFEDWAGAPGRALLASARALADTVNGIVDEETGLRMGGPVWKINAWANINGRGHGNRSHHHPAAFWSGVYWVDAGGEGCGGELELLDPRGVLPSFYAPRLRYALPGCLSAGGQDFVSAQTGTLILFPSWLAHAVRPYTGERRRISVAFNLSV